MELFFTPLHIFIATVSGFLIGALWFSPFLFMKAWRKGEGITKDQMPKRSIMYLLQINAYSFVAHGAMAAVLALLFDVLAVNSMGLALVFGLLLTFGFVITTKFIDMIYTPQGKHFEMRHQIKFLVQAGYYLTTVTIMSVVLFLVTYA